MTTPSQPSPDRFFQIATAYQDTAALRAAIELDVFTALADGPLTADEIARHCNAAPRGLRILCDYMTVLGFITKSDSRYALTQDSAVFLNRKSPAYAGGAMEFLLADHLEGAFRRLTESVRKGGTADPHRGSIAPEHPMWLTFARAMGGIMVRAADGLAELLALDPARPAKVLDVSASHGNWGIAVAKRYPKAQLIALDWAPVLELTRENARAAGIADRFQTLPGNAFEVDWGTDYEAILAPNFLHHFSAADCVRFMKKAHATLRPGGRLAIVEFVPNPDRVTPPAAAGFSLVMLATTPEGDAYTFDEYSGMLAQAGFPPPQAHTLPASINTVLLAKK
ncbi:MAG TPA: methyltransferase domain-containing protein [Verrucomicrobia bacterium]|nr:methyltransferase domain-containing protein [Verrucomicrobiota bacterium]HOB32197.1 class I SAM-dependent methyltransferase [Verrucomicrobiota bacterium]